MSVSDVFVFEVVELPRLVSERFDSLSVESLRCGSGWPSLRLRE